MQYNSRKFKKAMSLPDSDKKLSELETVGLCLGHFNKDIIIAECNRLRGLGYKSLAARYAESLQKEKEKAEKKEKQDE